MIEFRDYVHHRRNVVEDWLGGQPQGVRAEYDDLFGILEKLPFSQWRRPWVDVLHGRGLRGIYEFRVKVRVPYRIYGCKGPQEDQVTLCSAVCKSENRAAQESAQELAARRKAIVDSGQAVTVPHV